MAVRLQAKARMRGARASYRHAVACATKLQAALRRARVTEIMGDVFMALRMLRIGNIFMKFSHNGPPHDRIVWLEAVERVDEKGVKRHEETLRWADPEKKRKGVLKGEEAMCFLRDVIAVTEGVKSEVGKHQEKGFLQSLRAFKGGTSGIKQMDQSCCFTVLGKERTVDLQAPNRMIRRDWLLALRLVMTLRNGGIERIEDRRRIHAFVKPKPRSTRASKATSIGENFANFFRTRAGSSARLSAAARETKEAAAPERTFTFLPKRLSLVGSKPAASKLPPISSGKLEEESVGKGKLDEPSAGKGMLREPSAGKGKWFGGAGGSNKNLLGAAPASAPPASAPPASAPPASAPPETAAPANEAPPAAAPTDEGPSYRASLVASDDGEEEASTRQEEGGDEGVDAAGVAVVMREGPSQSTSLSPPLPLGKERTDSSIWDGSGRAASQMI